MSYPNDLALVVGMLEGECYNPLDAELALSWGITDENFDNFKDAVEYWKDWEKAKFITVVHLANNSPILNIVNYLDDFDRLAPVTANPTLADIEFYYFEDLDTILQIYKDLGRFDEFEMSLTDVDVRLLQEYFIGSLDICDRTVYFGKTF